MTRGPTPAAHLPQTEYSSVSTKKNRPKKTDPQKKPTHVESFAHPHGSVEENPAIPTLALVALPSALKA